MTQVASSPCLAEQAGARPFDGDASDFAQVRRWREAERARLRALRDAMPAPARAAAATAVAGHLDAFLHAEGIEPAGRILAVYWPVKAEPDLADWFARMRRRGAVLALPVPDRPPQPMTFRRWDDGAWLERGFGNIPVPAPDAPHVAPDVMLAPLIGWDDAGYRLGFGAGYFDRTLAALADPPVVIGVGYQSARLPSILPQPHDVPMQAILTETGLQVTRGALPSARGSS